jgi:hypothetical protein
MKLLFLFLALFCFAFGAGPDVLVASPLLTAAGPLTYNHQTGGGAYNDGTIGRDKDVVNSLEGGDFKCNDVASHFLRLAVSPSITGSRCVTTELTFTADTTGQPGVAYGDVPYFQIQFRNRTVENGVTCTQTCASGCPGGCSCTNLGVGKYGYDCGYSSSNQNEYASYVAGSKFFTAPMYSSNAADMYFKIKTCGLEAGEVIILRFDAKIFCLANSNPNGNIQAAHVETIDDNGNTYNGASTVPLKGVQYIIGATGCSPLGTNPISAADFNATITVFKPTQTNGGSYNMFLWYSWSKGAYRVQTFGVTNFTEVHTFDTECSFLHDGTVMYTQATCGCQATYIANTQPQLFFSVNSSYYNPVPTATSVIGSGGITYQVWNYTRSTTESSVLYLYILRSDNKTIIRADFYDGEYWLFSGYKQGDQATSNFQVTGGTNNATQCLCKKTLDIMIVAERTARVTRDEWAAVAAFIGVSLPAMTSTCSSGSFGFNDIANPSVCVPGVNYGLSVYDVTTAYPTTGVKTIMKFQTGGVRGTNAGNVYGAIGAEGCVGSGSACGLGVGNIVTAINSGVATLLASDRTAASKVLLLVNKGIQTADPVAVAAAVANATAKGVAVFAVTYFSTEFISDMKVMVSDPDNFAYRATLAELVVQNLYWPIEIVAKVCTPSALPCGTCCAQCEPTCGTCLSTPLNCPPSTNCSYTSRNTAAGCCILDFSTPSCPPKLDQCTAPPTCDAATGTCTYVNTCTGTQPGDQPNCYNYSCIPNATNPTGQYICAAIAKFTSDACTTRTCVNNAVVETPKDCSGSNTLCFTATCSLALGGACVATTPVTPPAWYNSSNNCMKCDGQTGYYNVSCTTTDACAPKTCDPNTGGCTSVPIVCTSNATFGKCNNPTCVGGVCVDNIKTCTAPTGVCQVCNNVFGDTGCCNPATGNCSFQTKTCSGNSCPCGSPFEVCTNDVCACPGTCSPTKAPTKAPTNAPNAPPVDTPAPTDAPTSACACPANTQCSASNCADPETGACNTVTRNCTQEAIDDGFFGTCVTATCVDATGCSYDFQTCTGGDVCNQEISDNSAAGCCVSTPVVCDDNPCYSYKCSVADGGCVQDQFLCSSSDMCKIPICTDQTCTTENVVCEIPDTECIVYTCDSSSGECSPSPKQSCDDGNECTIDSCDDATGCVNTPIECLDATDKCHTDPVCNPTNGQCESQAITCDDGIVCTDDTCDVATGCVYTLNDLGCQDTNPCVNSSVCTATGCQATLVDCGGQGLFCSTHYCEDYFGCTVEPTDCQANATNDTCSYANCSESLRECETIVKPCLAFLGVVAGLVVAGVVVGVVAAALIIAGAAAGGGAAAVSQNYGHEQGHHVNVNPLYNHQTKTAAGIA